MKQKSWIKKYGIHIAICTVILAVSFGINQKINWDQRYIYTVSEGVTTLLKDVELKAEETGKLTFTGWGFDTNYYDGNSTCELILQDTEAGEVLWPKMEKKAEPVEIPERYTDGEDYSAASFAGSIKEDKLKEDSVYEILLRYTSSYTNEAGVEKSYVTTVTMDEFLHQGEAEGYEITEYNPKTFVAPEIAGTELEKELEGARLFHYFPEGMWVYFTETDIYYVIKEETLEWERNPISPAHWNVKNINDLPEARKEYGFGSNSFYIKDRLDEGLESAGYVTAKIEIPSMHMTYFTTGLYYDGTGWSYCYGKQWK